MVVSLLRSGAPALLALALVPAAQNRKLNGPLARNYLSDVQSFATTSKGQVAYLASDYGPFDALLATSVESGPSVVLQAFARDGVAVGRMEATPDGSRLLYLADQDRNDVDELYSAPLDGSEPPVKLHENLAQQGILGFAIAPDSSRVVFERRSIEGSATVFRLYSAPVDGSVAPVLVTGKWRNRSYAITADSSRVVFRGREGNGRTELFSVPIDGSALPLRLHPPFLVNRDVESFLLSPDGTRAIYRADQDVNEAVELYSVRVDGSAPPVKLNAHLGVGRAVHADLAISPDSSRVTYVANQEAALDVALYSVPIRGGAAVRLSGGVSANVFTQQITPDGMLVIYTVFSGQDGQVFAAPIAGGVQPVLLSGRASVRRPGAIRVDAASRRVLYYTLAPTLVTFDLVSAPLAGAFGPVQASTARTLGHDVADFQLDPRGARVVLRPESGFLARRDLFSAPVDGSTPTVQITSVFGGVEQYAIDPSTGNVLYVAEEHDDDVRELYRVPVDGSAAPATRSDIRHNVRIVGSVLGMVVSPDGRTAVYQAGEEDGFDLYAVTLDAPAVRTRLGVGSRLLPWYWSFAITPDSRRVLVHAYDADPYGIDHNPLYSVPVDGSAPPVRLTPEPSPGELTSFATAPDSRHVVFACGTAANVLRIYSAPTDGSAPATELHDEGLAFLSISPDSSRVVYRTAVDLAPPQTWGLLSSPVGGGDPAVLFDPLPGHLAADCAISADSRSLVYAANPTGTFELFRVPVDGSGPSVPFVGPDRVRSSSVQLSADSTRIAYLADADGGGLPELYSVPLDASASAIELSAISSADRAVLQQRISSDSTRVAYVADQDANDVFEVYVRPLAGSAVPVKLSETPVLGGDAGLLGIDPGSTYAVYRADRFVDEQFELFAVKLDASALPVPLSAALPAGRDVLDYQLAPHGQRVLYRANPNRASQNELFVADLGGGPVVPVNGPLLGTTSANLTGLFTPDGERVLYLADEDFAGAIELYIDEALVARRRAKVMPHGF